LIDLFVQLFQKPSRRRSRDDDFASLARAFRDHLAPLGYSAVKFRGSKEPHVALFEKRVGTLSEARRERRRLDRYVFGDGGIRD
jgi:hypothetical protein